MCSSSLIYLLDLGEVMEEIMGRGLVNSLATKNPVLVTPVTRSCFCCCDFFEGELWCHDPLCCAVLFDVAKEGAKGCYHVALQWCFDVINATWWKPGFPCWQVSLFPQFCQWTPWWWCQKDSTCLSHISYGTRGQPSVHSHTYSHEESI